MLAVLASLLALVAGNVESRFFLPPSIRAPFYDVKFQDSPLEELPDFSSSQVLNLRYANIPIKCAIPEASHLHNDTILKPLEDAEVIEKAREAISELSELTLLTVDDVWGWIIDFDDSIVQCLPQREDAPNFTLKSNSFKEVVGQPGVADGQNLRTAQPVVVGDKHMLMATYTNGSLCDLTRKGRRTRLFFTCEPDAETPELLQIDEPYSCTYEVLIGTNTLCSFPEFRKPQLPSNDILCAPDTELASPSEIEDFRSIMSDMYAPLDEELVVNQSSRPAPAATHSHSFGEDSSSTEFYPEHSVGFDMTSGLIFFKGDESKFSGRVLDLVKEMFIEILDSFHWLLRNWLESISDHFSTGSGQSKLLESKEAIENELSSLIRDFSLEGLGSRVIRDGLLLFVEWPDEDNPVREGLVRLARGSDSISTDPEWIVNGMTYVLRNMSPEGLKRLVQLVPVSSVVPGSSVPTDGALEEPELSQSSPYLTANGAMSGINSPEHSSRDESAPAGLDTADDHNSESLGVSTSSNLAKDPGHSGPHPEFDKSGTPNQKSYTFVTHDEL